MVMNGLDRSELKKHQITRGILYSKTGQRTLLMSNVGYICITHDEIVHGMSIIYNDYNTAGNLNK